MTSKDREQMSGTPVIVNINNANAIEGVLYFITEPPLDQHGPSLQQWFLRVNASELLFGKDVLLNIHTVRGTAHASGGGRITKADITETETTVTIQGTTPLTWNRKRGDDDDS